MKPYEITAIYDSRYGEEYDQRFHNYDEWKVRTEAQAQIIETLQVNTGKGSNTKWLDVGCGTGFLLAKLTNSIRTGLELSPGMLVQARQKNPTIPIIEGSYMETKLFTEKSFDVISDTGWSHTYVDSFDQFEFMVKNLHYWLDENGVCFMGVAALKNLFNYVGKVPPTLPYEVGIDFGNGIIRIPAFEWTLYEANGHFHRMRIPQPEEYMEVFSKYFSDVYLVDYPPWYGGVIAFKQKQDPRLIEQIKESMSQLAEETKNFRPAPTDPRSLIRKSLSKVKQRIKRAVSRW